MPSEKRPLWTCPRCGHRFVTRNLWHSCTRYRIADHFKGKDSIVRHLYKQYVGIVRGFGPVTVFAQKTRIAFQARVRFAGAVVRKHWLEGGLWLKRRAEHPLFHRVEKIPPLAAELRLDSPFIPHLTVGNAAEAQACKRLADDLNARGVSIHGDINALDVVRYEGGRVESIGRIELADTP